MEDRRLQALVGRLADDGDWLRALANDPVAFSTMPGLSRADRAVFGAPRSPRKRARVGGAGSVAMSPGLLVRSRMRPGTPALQAASGGSPAATAVLAIFAIQAIVGVTSNVALVALATLGRRR
jgi:hypothetical protein